MERQELLLTALKYDSYGEKYLSDFDRMFIHKKMSATLNNERYDLTPELEEKILQKITYITNTNWQSPY